MQARPCFKCGERHWPDEPCPAEKWQKAAAKVVAKKVEAVTQPAASIPAPKAKGAAKIIEGLNEALAIAKGESQPFDRAAYQKAYMKAYWPRYRVAHPRARKKNPTGG